MVVSYLSLPFMPMACDRCGLYLFCCLLSLYFDHSVFAWVIEDLLPLPSMLEEKWCFLFSRIVFTHSNRKQPIAIKTLLFPHRWYHGPCELADFFFSSGPCMEICLSLSKFSSCHHCPPARITFCLHRCSLAPHTHSHIRMHMHAFALSTLSLFLALLYLRMGSKLNATC